MYPVSELSEERSGGVRGAQDSQVSSLVLCYHISAIFRKTGTQRQDVTGRGHPASKRSCYDSNNELWDFEGWGEGLIRMLCKRKENGGQNQNVSFMWFQHYKYACVCAQSCLTLWDMMDHSPPDSSVHGIFQGYWSGLPFPTPRYLPDLGIKPASLTSPALAGEFFTTLPPRKPKPMLWILAFIFIARNRRKYTKMLLVILK